MKLGLKLLTFCSTMALALEHNDHSLSFVSKGVDWNTRTIVNNKHAQSISISGNWHSPISEGKCKGFLLSINPDFYGVRLSLQEGRFINNSMKL